MCWRAWWWDLLQLVLRLQARSQGQGQPKRGWCRRHPRWRGRQQCLPKVNIIPINLFALGVVYFDQQTCICMVENDEKHLMIFECFPLFYTTPLSFEMLIMWNGEILGFHSMGPRICFLQSRSFLLFRMQWGSEHQTFK